MAEQQRSCRSGRRITPPSAPGRYQKHKVVGFDTFMPHYLRRPGADRAFAEAFRREPSYSGVSLESLREAAGRTGVGHRIELVQGDVRQTIERYVEDNPGFRIAVLYLDFDVALPTMAALECLYNRVVHGGIIVFGEYGLAACTEANAVDNFLRDRGISVKLRSLSWNMSPTAFFVTP